MNKFLRKAMILALAGTMTLGMSSTALAAPNTGKNSDSKFTTNGASDTPDDTGSINLIKDYKKGSDNQSGTVSPAENFVFTIEPYAVWNAGASNGIAGGAAYTVRNMPLLGTNIYGKIVVDSNSRKTTVTISANAGDAEKTSNLTNLSQEVSIPTYDSVGDFWYKVTETDNNVAGVIYGTNDSKTEDTKVANGAHEGVYYIHVQVTNAPNGGYTRTVTMHKTAPALTTNNLATTNTEYEVWYGQNNSGADKKVNDIQNKYYAGSLNITKEVTGNAGDKNELFRVTVVFTNQSDAKMNSNITYKNYYDENGNFTKHATSLVWTDNLSNENDHTHKVSFYVKDGTTVTFDNIPYGVTYTITETQPGDDKYTHSFKYTASQDENPAFNGKNTANGLIADTVAAEIGTWDNANATGSITDDLDTVTITNDKQSTIDVGVITSNAPYAAMLVLAGLAVLLYVRRRKNMIEE